MSVFELYLRLGFKHIIDFAGYDHIVFVLVLCAGYRFNEIKKVLLLITAFTIGHSITLALSTLKIILVPAPIIEFLIPVTIFITAVSNLVSSNHQKRQFVYSFALFFGLIHGLGFSNYLKQLLGTETNILSPLLAFNIGLEIGHIVILTSYFTAMLLIIKAANINQKLWQSGISIAAVLVALFLIFQNKIW